MRKYTIMIAWLAGMFLLGTTFAYGADPGAVVHPRPGVIVIGDDDGGGIDDHMKFYNRIAQARVPVRVEGICVSACTLVLELPKDQACIAPTASFGFHLATAGKTPLPDFTQSLILRYYPLAVQQWISEWVKKHGPLTVDHITYMTGNEAIALGVFPACGD